MELISVCMVLRIDKNCSNKNTLFGVPHGLEETLSTICFEDEAGNAVTVNAGCYQKMLSHFI